MLWCERNLTSTKRCFRVRGIHDFETRQQLPSVCPASCKWSTWWSSSSGGMFEFDTVVRSGAWPIALTTPLAIDLMCSPCKAAWQKDPRVTRVQVTGYEPVWTADDIVPDARAKSTVGAWRFPATSPTPCISREGVFFMLVDGFSSLRGPLNEFAPPGCPPSRRRRCVPQEALGNCARVLGRSRQNRVRSHHVCVQRSH